jgi:glycerol-3-phosphate acyltransferase PlsY
MIQPLFLALGAYLLGSIPFGLLLVRWRLGIDIRTQGSGNIGMTNVWRVAGPALGITTLLLDIAKGVGTVLLARHLAPEDASLAVLAAAAVLLGNIFPLFLKFRGGKGIGVSSGVFFSLLPLESAVGLGLFLVALLATRMISVGSLSGATAMALLALHHLGWDWYSGLALCAALMVWWTHRENLKRILKGTENRIGKKK